jgi:hypothetical protein
LLEDFLQEINTVSAYTDKIKGFTFIAVLVLLNEQFAYCSKVTHNVRSSRTSLPFKNNSIQKRFKETFEKVSVFNDFIIAIDVAFEIMVVQQ